MSKHPVNMFSLLPFLLLMAPLMCVLAAFGVIGWDVVAGVVIAVGVPALVARAATGSGKR
ncbi:hypothetical protein ACGFW5_02135 [Streptomyces sp. NPDC048416]|uniref:hypothetical protein n=1 Tax=Streptomyces sp. NPDC048416 TaxID=3365546 RepID=UPI003717218B